MIPKVIRRRIRPLWVAGLASAAWMNRKDLARWAEFIRRAIRQRRALSLSDLITEAKVRFALTSDPVLRRDPALKDLAVRDGVVTLLTNTPAWPDSAAHVKRLKQVRGIADVTALQVVGA
ncbi:MAG TPA: hypothetical protein VH761_01845 [Ilumatobacteraceae bacterium]|jgi:hypothetical protein